MTQSPENERRRFTRVNFNTSATITQGELAFDADLLDISLNGLLVETPSNYTLRSDQETHANITLSDETTIRMTLMLIHSSNETLGFRCESIDIESMRYLRRLLELNIDDPNAAERVLNEILHNDH